MGLLEGKTALITGAARGIGKAIALKYAAEGCNIAFTDLSTRRQRKRLPLWVSRPRATPLMLPTSLRPKRLSRPLRKSSAQLIFW